MKEFFSIIEVAKLAGVSRMTVYNWVKQGKIKAVRVGRSFAIPAKIVKKYIVDIKGKALTEKDKRIIEESVTKTMDEYGEVLRRLGNE